MDLHRSGVDEIVDAWPVTKQTADDQAVMAVDCAGGFEMEVKGESHYQDAIGECVRLCALEQTSDESCRCDFSVRLSREPENAYDANAVAIRSAAGRTLGYLSRDDAREFAPVLDRIGEFAVVQCPARAYGRRARPAAAWNFGIWLDLPTASDLLEAIRDLGAETLAEMRGEGGLVRQRDAMSDGLVAGPLRAAAALPKRPIGGYDRTHGGSGPGMEVTCPACGTAQRAVGGVAGFRCRSCRRDVWNINCHRCHKACSIYGSAVGSGALEFRCGNCRAKNTITKQSLRSISANVRRAERAEAAEQREAAAQAKELKQRHADGRESEAIRTTSHLQAALANLAKVLEGTTDVPFEFGQLKSVMTRPVFAPGALGRPEDAPSIDSFLPPQPQGLGAHLPGTKRKHQEQVAAAETAFAEASKQHAAREAERIAALDEARQAFDERVSELEAATRHQNDDVDQLEERFLAGDGDAVVEYYSFVLRSIRLPYEPPDEEPRLAYSTESRQLVIELELPSLDVVPDAREYRYVKTRDEIKTVALPAAERKRVYASLIAQVALSVLRATFQGDPHSIVETVVLNGHVHTIDKRTGQPIHPCLVTVRTTRERFDQLNLALVDPAECLRGLNASVSKSPAEMVPVRPMLEFDMVDPRFVGEENVLESLDTRPNLMELTPSEFESLITNLFEKMGLATRLTQASRDGGVDCVAYDSRPIFGGKVVIQAKRYRNTVGVSAVRDLFGTMQNEGATKGILVTTSGYGQASNDFANGKPLELIDGGNLIYLLKEHTDIDAKIVVPDDWDEPELPA